MSMGSGNWLQPFPEQRPTPTMDRLHNECDKETAHTIRLRLHCAATWKPFQPFVKRETLFKSRLLEKIQVALGVDESPLLHVLEGCALYVECIHRKYDDDSVHASVSLSLLTNRDDSWNDQASQIAAEVLKSTLLLPGAVNALIDLIVSRAALAAGSRKSAAVGDASRRSREVLSSADASTPAPPQLALENDGKSVTLDGERLTVTSAGWKFLKRLVTAKASGDPDVKAMSFEAERIGRPDRIFRKLPKELKRIVLRPKRGGRCYRLK